MIAIVRTDAKQVDFINLVDELNKFLAVTDGDDHEFYNQYNKLDAIKYVVVAYKDDIPLGCGAIKAYDQDTFEVKRMYVNQQHRGKRIAATILKALETWTKELSGSRCILETGLRQKSAIALYKREGYSIIPNYGQYIGIPNSVCFEKILP